MLKKLPLIKLFCTIVLVGFAGIYAFAQAQHTNGFLLQDSQKLEALKKQYKDGDAAVVKDVNTLLAEADKVLTAGPFSVTLRKTKVAPSGNLHDYVSQAPYWWADPSKSDGKPYIRKDGERNPEIYQLHDDSQMGEMSQAVKKLGFAYYFTGDEKYSQKAALLLKVWFIDADTKMAPNLNYAQYIPGINDGRGIGIIESRGLSDIPDAIAMLQIDKKFPLEVTEGVKSWFKDYLNWLQTSKNGKDELGSKNNHGTFYDMQVVDFALFTGNDKIAYDVLEKRTIGERIDTQFTTDGKQPLELERTKSWGYSNMNLEGWCKLAILANHVNIDLWHADRNGKSIEKTIKYLQPFLLKQDKWTYKQIEPIGYKETLGIFAMAEGQYPGIDFQKVFQMYTHPRPWM